jgi:hypothetical protein
MVECHENGDSLSGERIACQARKIRDKPLTQGSSCHRIQNVVCETNAYCVIEKEFKFKRD